MVCYVFPRSHCKSRYLNLNGMSKGIYVVEVGVLSIESFKLIFSFVVIAHVQSHSKPKYYPYKYQI